MLHRIEKLRRFLRWKLALPDGLPIWWHVGRPNFGDDINPSLFQKVHGLPVRFASDRRRPHILGAGSILECATSASIVCGSGLLEPATGPLTTGRIAAVRGRLSAAACDADPSVVLGDPLVLIDAFVERPAPRHRFGYVPHITSAARWRNLAEGRRRAIIDPAWPPWRVVEAIASCAIVFSQSLHGLIVADALGVPNIWVAPSNAMRGGRFKFDDYFSTLDAGKDPVRVSTDIFTAPERYDAGVNRYRFCKQRYRETLAEACAACHAEATRAR